MSNQDLPLRERRAIALVNAFGDKAPKWAKEIVASLRAA